ncbi:MAG: primosomal protein N' [Deltaproteobacteria bacterium]|nr:primosomal protein N' [Deltaproteobacteria bacterium]
MARIAEVAVPLPVPGPFHYSIPAPFQGGIEVGSGVTVPFGNRRLTGYVVDLLDAVPEGSPELKDIVALGDEGPLFPPELVPLYQWIARYYAHPLGEVVRTALPGSTRTATRAVVHLLPEGVGALESGAAALDPQGLALLKRLHRATDTRLTLRTLKREDRSFAGAALRRAEKEGWVSRTQEAAHKAVTVKREAYYSLAGSLEQARNAFARPGPVRDRLLEYIDRFSPASHTELKDAFPNLGGALRALKNKEVLSIEQREVRSDAAERVRIDDADRVPRAPTTAQREALATLATALDTHAYGGFLLHGVTGSGKTEVYLQTAGKVLDEGGAAIFLVPEIGLTPQFLSRFRARFGEETVGVLHSGLTERERFDEWRRIGAGRARLVIGPRSAVFAPVRDLRLIVVDEEHDGSYKQEEGLRYNARDVALTRCAMAKAVAVLGSATPSLESLHLANEGRITLLSMPDRVSGRPMPPVEIVDLRQHPTEDPDSPGALLSPPLRRALEENLESGGQTILLLNRRGFATVVLCTGCGTHFRCEDCDVSMTYHGRRHQVMCHWCGKTLPMPDVCPACHAKDTLRLTGRGTERLEEEMLALWPEMRLDRMDADTTRSRSSHRRILDRFRDGEVDVLVGTQMVAKGHDFPRVTLVGVLHADAALHLPDVRAAERTFQLIAQVAGRAGRADRPGKVLVQTWHPDHHAILRASEHDFAGFIAREMPLRKGLGYPPFWRMTMFRVSSPEEHLAHKAVWMTKDLIDRGGGYVTSAGGRMRIRGPAPAPMYRVRGRYRWQILVTASDHKAMSRLLHSIGAAVHEVGKQVGKDTRVVIDRDPVGML